jgi:hypothetical protein
LQRRSFLHDIADSIFFQAKTVRLATPFCSEEAKNATIMNGQTRIPIQTSKNAIEYGAAVFNKLYALFAVIKIMNDSGNKTEVNHLSNIGKDIADDAAGALWAHLLGKKGGEK